MPGPWPGLPKVYQRRRTFGDCWCKIVYRPMCFMSPAKLNQQSQSC